LANPVDVGPVRHFGNKLRAAKKVSEYRMLLKDMDFRIFLPLRNEYLKDFSDFECECYFEVSIECAQMPESIASTVRFVEHVVRKNIPGDFVECGVFMGATPYVIGKTMMRLGETDRQIFVCEPRSSRDGLRTRKPPAVNLIAMSGCR
jgi:hypothetical protein